MSITDRPLRRGAALGRVAVVAAVALTFYGLSTPAAEAAEYRYANNVNTDDGVVHSTGLRSSVTGGRSSTHGVSLAINHVITYNPAPGYVEHGHAYGAGATNLSHLRVSNTYNKCYWLRPGTGGRTEISCWVKY